MASSAVGDIVSHLNQVCTQKGAPYNSYRCGFVSWDDVSRFKVGDMLSCVGSNITDTRLSARDGTPLYTVRTDNWNEKLGSVRADDITVLIDDKTGSIGSEGGFAPPGMEDTGCANRDEVLLTPISLRSFLAGAGRYGAYAGLLDSVDLCDPTLDENVSVRFQTTFLPVNPGKNAKMEFCNSMYNYQTTSYDDPRNLVLLATSQGVSLQQDGIGQQQMFLHLVEKDGTIKQHWLEAERTEHKVGDEQVESVESSLEAKALARAKEMAARATAEKAEQAAKKALESGDAETAARASDMAMEAALARQVAREAELAAERQERIVDDANDAAAKGKAVAATFGVNGMGSRVNALLTIQIPIKQEAPPSRPSTWNYTSSTTTMGNAFGVKLGSATVASAVWFNSKVEVVPNDHGDRTTDSAIFFPEDGSIPLVGTLARSMRHSSPERFVEGCACMRGARPGDAGDTVETHVSRLKLREKGEQFVVGPNDLTPLEVDALLVEKMAENVQEFLSKKETGVVLGVPAWFSDAQRLETKEVATVAGLDVLRVINEPTAAAVAYHLDECSCDEANFVVVDVGATRTDVTLLTIDEGIFEIKATVKDYTVCGLAQDYSLRNFVEGKLAAAGATKLSVRAERKLDAVCKRAKHDLSSLLEVDIDFSDIVGDHEVLSFSHLSLTRARFDDLIRSQTQALSALVERVLLDAQVTKSDIKGIVTSGGCMNVPCLKTAFMKIFDSVDVYDHIRPEEVVVYGLAQQAAILSGSDSSPACDLLLLDVSPLSLGVACVDPSMRSLPCDHSQQTIMVPLIPRNTTIPCKRRATFTTCRDGQPTVLVEVVEGERPVAALNRSYGTLEVAVEVLPAGTATVEVEYNIDANGILHVSATSSKDVKTLVITNDKGRLSNKEIEQMLEDAKLLAHVDKAKQREILELNMREEGFANAARVSRGGEAGVFQGLRKTTPERAFQHCTVTVQFYHTVTGGVPSAEDVMAAIDDMERCYRACGWTGNLVDADAPFFSVGGGGPVVEEVD